MKSLRPLGGKSLTEIDRAQNPRVSPLASGTSLRVAISSRDYGIELNAPVIGREVTCTFKEPSSLSTSVVSAELGELHMHLIILTYLLLQQA